MNIPHLGARRRNCKHGHAMRDDNVYVWNGKRYCATCKRDTSLRWYYANK